MNKVSVAMCTYNGEKYLSEQLESIINQTVQPDEIVICDDCSVDKSINVAKSMLANWQGQVKIIKNEYNLGYKLNFQKAISLCTGNIIFLSDQDDMWHKDKVKKVMAVFNADEAAIMVFHDVNIVDDILSVKETSFWKGLQFSPEAFFNKDYDILYRHNVVQGAACAFRRELFGYAQPFCKEAHHDEWLALVAQLNNKIVPIPEQLAYYRQSADNALGSGDWCITSKLRRWISLIKKTSQEHYNELVRRYFVLSDFESKYDKLSPLGKRYIPYLRRRLDKRILYRRINEYIKLECTVWIGIKEWTKDIITDFLVE